MSEWVVLDITAMVKTTKKEKVLKILKDVSHHQYKKEKYYIQKYFI